METLRDWSFVLGPLGGIVLLPMAWVVINNSGLLRFKRPMTMLVLAVGVLIAVHWVVWFFSFETSEAYPTETYTNDLFGVSIVLMYVSALGCLTAYLAAGLAWVLGRKSSQTQNA